MRLRSTCTSHKRSIHGRLRLAFAVALATAPGIALAVEKLPCSLPVPLNHPEHCEAGLLPYPFGPTKQRDCAKPEERLERLVTLVGMHRGNLHRGTSGRQGAVPGSEVAPATLNQVSMPAMSFHAVPSQVVPASGTQSAGPVSDEASVPELPTLASPHALPVAQLAEAAPSLPALEAQPSLGLDLEPTSESQPKLSQSLLDIDIPLDIMQPAQPAQPSQPSAELAISMESSSAVGLSDASTVVAASRDRQPELIQPAKSLSLTTRQPSSQSVNLSLSNAPLAASPATGLLKSSLASATRGAAQTYALSDATLDDSQSSDRGVALHLSSASELPMKVSPAASGKAASENPLFAQRGSAMQIRIEGQPAPMLSARTAEEMHNISPAAPFPSMGHPAHSAADQPESIHRVKAAFATRTSVIPARDIERSMNTLGRDAKQTRESLTIGLQESQTLTAQFVITEMSVEHPTICQLLQTGESSLSVVGVRPGSTRIALVMVNDAGERQVEIREVSVISSPAAAQSLPDVASEISRAVGRLVPSSDVEVVAYEDYLLVHGFTHYESDAKKILSLVRKTSLVPVVDQLKSNEQ